MDGKAWQKVTDADLMVVKKNAAGKYEVAHVEEVKSGEKDKAGKAKEQIDRVAETLQKISVGDESVRIVSKRNGQATNISDQYDLTTFSKDKAATRGADDRPHFDQSLGLTSSQIKRLANEIITKYQTKGGK